MNRNFVKYKNADFIAKVKVLHGCSDNKKTLVSIIIPTSDGYRNGYMPKLLNQIRQQTLQDYEVIIIQGDYRQGRAINHAVSMAKGKYIITLDDDTSLPDPYTIKKLVSAMEAYPDIGIAGGNNVVPTDAMPFVRRVMRELPRRSWTPVKVITDSDLAEHPCMIMRVEEFKRVGGENELIPRGLDPYLREQFRKIGKRVVVVPDVIYHHLPPDSLTKLLRQFYRNGCQASYTRRNYPQWIIETPSEHGPFKSNVSFLKRIFRFPVRLFEALITWRYTWFLSELAYGVGYFWDMFLERSLKGGYSSEKYLN